MHWALLGCASSYAMFCIELYYTSNFVALRCKLCYIMLHYVLYSATLHSNSTMLHYVRFLLRYTVSFVALRALSHYIVLCYKLYCTVSFTITLLHCARLQFCYVALWILLCYAMNFATLCVEFCYELYYASSFTNLSSNNLHTQNKQLTWEKLHT